MKRRRLWYLVPALIVAAVGAALVARYGVPASIRSAMGRQDGTRSYSIVAPRFFHEELSQEIARAGAWNACPMIVADGILGGPVKVYGIDQRFWQVNGLPDPGLRDNEALLSAALGKNFQGSPMLTIQIQKPVAIALTVTSRGALDRAHMGGFSIEPAKGSVKALFVPFRVLQKALVQEQKANVILITTNRRGSETKTIAQALRERTTPADVGLQVRQLEGSEVAIESDAGLISEPLEAAIGNACSNLQVSPNPVVSGIAESIQARGKSIPYSFVAAVGDGLLLVPPDKVVLTDWAARDLTARSGDPITLELYVKQGGAVVTKTLTMPLDRVIPMQGIALDPNLAPDDPGITEAQSMHEWKAPFPLDFGLLRPQDEEYWTEFRTAPKAFISLTTAQQFWGSPAGKATSIRVNLKSGVIDNATAVEGLLLALQAETDPLAVGYSVQELPRRRFMALR